MLKELLDFLLENKKWLFSGIGILIVGIVINLLIDYIIKIKKAKTNNTFALWMREYGELIFKAANAIAVALIIASVSHDYLVKFAQRIEDPVNSKAVEDQLQSLNNIEGSINQLISFINLQRFKLRESEALLASLKEEHDKLRPVVETERETIGRIFALQAQMTADTIWKERIISFFLGVLASVIASFVYSLIQRLYKKGNVNE